ncbi:response regulator receiver domain [Parasedimentitalea psychrophila]|uniref:Response regulator receiver domain n=1 Tax=Parasedimentitalea psychrophila TaxID=2997337 RepID=A0A9Y2NZM7_9RHOB|nr:response regulator receiver domain [Parasedimentitalea psychrophila]WIY23761.1 response regulator receiver domain [Parasedimentitalea psychrophila]
MEYKDLIDEVFIAPVRSATIIDDGYPTIDNLVTGAVLRDPSSDRFTGEGTDEFENPTEVARRLKELRGKALVVDVRNDVSDPDNGAGYHHSDLVVLDYQLDGSLGDGSKSKAIARQLLAKNDHFNLVILHTQAVIERVFQDVLLSLLSRVENRHQSLVEAGEDLAAEKGVEVEEIFGVEQYLLLRSLGLDEFRRVLRDEEIRKGTDALIGFHEVIENKNLNPTHIIQLLAACVDDFERKQNISNEAIVGLSWSKDSVLWIKSDRGFIAFSSKANDPSLWEVLKRALDDWSPSPSRLISGKIRNILHQQGSQIEGLLLEDSHVGALFYKRFIEESDDDARSSLISSEVGRQIEFYRGNCEGEIIDFSGKLVESEKGGIRHSAKYAVDLSDGDELMSAHDKLNAHVSCKIANGTHLTTGHILTANNEVWVVVSPSCDLVPGQKVSKAKGYLQFAAAKLEPLSDISECRAESHTGNFLFLPDNGKIKAYGIYPSAGRGGAGDRHLVYSYWLASNSGCYSSESTIKAYRESIVGDNQLGFQEFTFTRHAVQLRYEYALNLLSKVGTHASRVGLDFLSPK